MSAKFLVVALLLIERDGRLLLLKRSASKDHAPGEWEPGSGRVEAGESAVEAAYREAKEETGLDVEVLGPIDTFRFERGPTREEAIGIAFHCRATGGTLSLSPEHDEAKWVPIEELLAVDCADVIRRCFQTILAPRG